MERILEVRVMFEPSRLQGECLADAYECVVPIVRRSLGVRSRGADVSRGAVTRRVGGSEA